MAFANYNHQLTALHLAILRRESKPPLAKNYESDNVTSKPWEKKPLQYEKAWLKNMSPNPRPSIQVDDSGS